MPRPLRCALPLAALLAVLLATGAHGASPPLACGDVITHDTTLRADLRNCPGNGLVIGAPNIVLDLNGHTIDGDGVLGCADEYACDYGVDNTAGFAGVTIRRGAIRDFATAVFVAGASGARVSGIASVHNVLGGVLLIATPGAQVVGNVIAANGLTTDQAGLIVFDSDGVRIERNVVRANGDIGMFLEGLTGSVLRQNVVSANPEDGIGLDGSGNELRRNTVYDNGDNVTLGGDDNVVAQNVISRSRGFADDPVGGFGILVSGGSRNVLADNVIDRSASNGVRVTAFDVGESGPSEDNVVRGNVVTRSRLDGVLIDDTAPGSLVLRNRVSGSGDDGIDVQAPTATLTRNLAVRNAALGIEAVSGVIDGHGNAASGNGDPAQCQGVVCG